MTTTNANANPANITFGIEIETHLPAADNTQINGYHTQNHRAAEVSWLPAGWKAERDSSLRVPAGRKGAEFVSPKLRGEAGLAEAHAAIKAINERGAKVNESCGVHVTITFPANDGAALARLISLFARYEDGLFASTGSKRRRDGRWAKGVKGYAAGLTKNGDKIDAATSGAKSGRYHALNLTHLAAGYNRIEFRLFSGSVNADKIIAWVRLALALAEYALTTRRAVGFDDRSKDERFGGPGSRSLTQLLCRLGWLTWKAWGYNGHTYGALTADGLPAISESCELLRKLAKKYDEQA